MWSYEKLYSWHSRTKPYYHLINFWQLIRYQSTLVEQNKTFQSLKYPLSLNSCKYFFSFDLKTSDEFECLDTWRYFLVVPSTFFHTTLPKTSINYLNLIPKQNCRFFFSFVLSTYNSSQQLYRNGNDLYRCLM